MMDALQLGASLYVPATRSDLAPIGNRVKYPNLRSVIFCTEDAIRSSEVPMALAHLGRALRRFEPTPLQRFVRVRNPAILAELLQMEGVANLSGFVLPKATRRNLEEYADVLERDSRFLVMIVLETAEVFDPAEMARLRSQMLTAPWHDRVLSLRIGGNDLLQHLGLRRPRGRSIYTTPLGPVIAQLVTTFRPHGFNLTAPVFEWINRNRLLASETRADVAHGLFGKSAIHPDQLPVIEFAYQVSARDFEAAERILDEAAPPVFRLHDAMCEPATHRAWATITRERGRLYGVRAVSPRPRLLPATSSGK